MTTKREARRGVISDMAAFVHAPLSTANISLRTCFPTLQSLSCPQSYEAVRKAFMGVNIRDRKTCAGAKVGSSVRSRALSDRRFQGRLFFRSTSDTHSESNVIKMIVSPDRNDNNDLNKRVETPSESLSEMVARIARRSLVDAPPRPEDSEGSKTSAESSSTKTTTTNSMDNNSKKKQGVLWPHPKAPPSLNGASAVRGWSAPAVLADEQQVTNIEPAVSLESTTATTATPSRRKRRKKQSSGSTNGGDRATEAAPLKAAVVESTAPASDAVQVYWGYTQPPETDLGMSTREKNAASFDDKKKTSLSSDTASLIWPTGPPVESTLKRSTRTQRKRRGKASSSSSSSSSSDPMIWPSLAGVIADGAGPIAPSKAIINSNNNNNINNSTSSNYMLPPTISSPLISLAEWSAALPAPTPPTAEWERLSPAPGYTESQQHPAPQQRPMRNSYQPGPISSPQPSAPFSYLFSSSYGPLTPSSSLPLSSSMPAPVPLLGPSPLAAAALAATKSLSSFPPPPPSAPAPPPSSQAALIAPVTKSRRKRGGSPSVREKAVAGNGVEEGEFNPYEQVLVEAPEIESKLQYKFRDKHLLALAFVHSSSGNNTGLRNHPLKPMLDNERLEFIGDAVFSLLIADHLYRSLPYADEGEISRLRSHLVQASSCARYVESLGIANHLQVVSSKRGPSTPNRHLMADLFEAVLGAIYLDSGGLATAEWFIFHHLSKEFENILLSPPRNWKGILQDVAQKKYREVPRYEDLGTEALPPGNSYSKEWIVGAMLKNQVVAQGRGVSKKEAQQAAARSALIALGHLADVAPAEAEAAAREEAERAVDDEEDEEEESERETAEDNGPSSVLAPVSPFESRGHQYVDVARAIAAKFAERAAEHDRAVSFPHKNFFDIRASGISKMVVPKEFGGWGATLSEACAAVEALAEGDGSTALSLSMHLQTVGEMADRRGWPDGLFEELCRDIVERGALINTTNIEPDENGRDVSSNGGGRPNTRARPVFVGGEVDHWIINGAKTRAVMAPVLDYFIVPATVQLDSEGELVGQFVVPRSAGVSFAESVHTMGMRSTGAHDVIFRDVRVPRRNLLLKTTISGPDSNSTPFSFEPLARASAWSLGLVSGVHLGIAKSAIRCTARYVSERVAALTNRRDTDINGFAEYDSILRKLGKAELLLQQSRAMLYQATDWWERYPDLHDQLLSPLVSAKVTSQNNSIAICEICIRVTGSLGLTQALPLERYLRDVYAGITHPLTDENALRVLGRSVLDGIENDTSA